jgi:PAS domain S-box-containing protein
MQVDSRSLIKNQFLAIALVAFATVVTYENAFLRDKHNFAVYLAMVTLVAWYGGLLPAITATMLSALSFAYFIAPPHGFRVASTDDVIRIILFIMIAMLISLTHWQRLQAERARRFTERRLQLSLDAARMGAWDLDLEHGAFWWSPSLERIFGRPPGSFSETYEGFLGYIHPDDRDFVDRAVTRTIENGVDYEIEHRIVRPDGSVRWITTRGRIFYNDQSRPERMMGVVADITDQRKPDEPKPSRSEPLPATVLRKPDAEKSAT